MSSFNSDFYQKDGPFRQPGLHWKKNPILSYELLLSSCFFQFFPGRNNLKFLDTVTPQIVSFLPSILSTFNTLHGHYSIYEVKNYHNAETI